MGGRPNALRRVRRSRRLAGLGPSSVRPVRRPGASSKARRRCGRCSPCAAESSSTADTETAEPMETAPAVKATRTECPSLRPEGDDAVRCWATVVAPSTSRRAVAGGANLVSDRNSPAAAAAEKTRSPGQSSSRTRPVRSSRRELSAPGVSNSEPAEGIEVVAGDAGSSQPSTCAEQQSGREPVEQRRPAHEFIRTFPDHTGAVPTQGESFCCCPKKAQTKDLQCPCGEEDSSQKLIPYVEMLFYRASFDIL